MSFRIDQLDVLNLATVGNSITAGSFVRSGGTSSQFLKADGTVDTNAYITGITSTMVTTALGYTPVPNTRNITINGVTQDLSVDRTWTISAGVASVSGSGAGISVSPTTGAVVVSNTGVTSNVAGTGITVSGATGAVTITNTGVTSIVAGTAITISGATGAVTINNAGVTSLNGSTGALTGFATQAWVTSQGYITSASVGNGTLTLAVSGSGLSGSASFTANQSTATTFTVTSNATNANTASTIVFRDASGNFSAGRITTTGLYGPSTSGNIAIWQYDASNTGYGIVYNEASPDTLRIDVSGNALTGTPDFLVGPDYAQINGNTVLHAGNYNSYSPTLTGGGASGTWGINITGSASSATNADTVDGYHASTSTIGNYIVVRDGNGYIFGNYINMTDDGNPGGGTSISSFITKQGDNYYRSVSPTNAMASIRGVASGSWGINITGTAGSETLATVTGRGASTSTAVSFNNVVSVTSSSIGMDWWRDGSGTYMEFYGTSTATRKLRLQGSNGSGSYAQWFIDGGNGEIYGAAGGVTNFLMNSSVVYLRHGGSDKFWTGSDGTRNAGWLYMQNGGNGIHYPGYNSHFYMPGGNYWHINPTEGSGYGALILYSHYNGSSGGSANRKGYLYYDSNGFGLLGGGDGDWAINVNTSTSKYVTIGGHQGSNACCSVSGVRLMFGGGNSDAQNNYYIGTNYNNYNGNYNKLDLAWHTGIRIGAQTVYGGIRMYNDEDFSSLIFSVGEGDSNVRVTNNLFMGGNLVATQSWVTSQGYVTGGPFVQNVLGDSGAYNLNTSGQQAFFRFSTGAWVNGPTTGNYSHVLSVNGATDNRTFQVYFGDVPGYLWWRPNQGGSWHGWERILTSYNYNGWAPTLTGGGASGTWSINITGSASSATNSTNTSNISLTSLGNGSMNVSNGASAVYRNENGNGGNLSYAPVLHLGGGDTMWQIQGDYYNSSTLQWRAGYAGTWYSWRTILHNANYNSYSPTLTGGGASGTWGISITGNADTVDGYHASNFLGYFGNSYYQVNTWLQMNGSHGMYWPSYYGLHVYANDGGSYGSLQIGGSKNGWSGIYFNVSGNTVMWNNNESGAHMQGYGWQWRWYQGTMYVSRSTYGGGTEYTVWDSGNASRAGNSLLMYYQGFTLDANTMDGNSSGFTYSVNAPYTGPIVRFSETGYSLQLNAAYAGGGNLIAFRTRNGDAGTWNPWREFITTGNIGSQNVNYASQAGTASFAASAGNTSSISSATGGSYTWTGQQYFQSNLGGYCGSLSGPPLQAYSTSNNSAFMSFHKGGYYAVNMGLDADSVLRIGGWSAASNRWQLDMSGNMTVAGDVTAYSDARVKENVETVEDALDKVLNLRGVYYNRTDSEDKRRKVGVIAQEILEVIPEVVGQDNDGMYNVSYGNIVGVLIEAIKEQQKQIDELKAKLN